MGLSVQKHSTLDLVEALQVIPTATPKESGEALKVIPTVKPKESGKRKRHTQKTTAKTDPQKQKKPRQTQVTKGEKEVSHGSKAAIKSGKGKKAKKKSESKQMADSSRKALARAIANKSVKVPRAEDVIAKNLQAAPSFVAPQLTVTGRSSSPVMVVGGEPTMAISRMLTPLLATGGDTSGTNGSNRKTESKGATNNEVTIKPALSIFTDCCQMKN